MKEYAYILLSNDSGERIKLQNAPIGWSEAKVNIIRDLTYFGLYKSLSVEFSFVGDGYKFLQRQRLIFGQDADVLIRLYRGNQFIFEGKVNIENFKEDRKYKKFQVDIIQSAFVQKFQNRESIKYNLLNNISADRNSITPAIPVTALIRDRVLQRYSEFDGVIWGTTADPQIYHHTLPFDLKINDNPDVQSIGAIELSHNIEELYIRQNSIFENKTGIPQTLKINWSINYTMTYEGPTLPHKLGPVGLPPWISRMVNIFYFQIRNEDNTVDQTLFTRTFVNSFGTFNDSFNNNITVMPGQYVIFSCERWVDVWNGSGYGRFVMGSGPIEESIPMNTYKVKTVYNDMKMTILQDSVFPDTQAPVILPHELFTNLIAQITGKDNAFYSEIFGRIDLGYESDGQFAYLGITKGDLLRGVPIEDTQVATSMRDAYRSYNILNLAVLIENNNRIRIDPKDKMFNRDIIVDLGEVSELEITSAKAFMFNSVLVGYPKTEYEQDNGRDEFNTEVQYTNSFRGVKNELDIRSVYRGDGRGIEEARRLQIAITGTKDSRYDDKIFFIDLVKEGPVLKSRRMEGINFVGGIINSNTAMNVRISPGQIMLMWQRYLAIPLHRKEKVYYFQSKDKNSGFQVITPLGSSFDGEDLQLQQPAYFLTEYHEFTHPITFSNLFSLIKNPFGIVKFTYEKEVFYDHLFEVDAEIEMKGASWKMIGTKPTPVLVEDPEDEMNVLKYDDGVNDFLKYDDGLNDVILYE